MTKEEIKVFDNEYKVFALRANEVHRAVNQKYDDKPYLYHLYHVAKHVSEYFPSDEKKYYVPTLFGAFFHDSIEDARLTYNDVLKIAKEYMSDEKALMATEIVYALTNEKGRNRHERANDKYYEGIRTTKYAPIVKAADRLANYTYAKNIHSKMEKCYKDEMEEFVKKALTAEDGTFLVPKEMVDELFS